VRVFVRHSSVHVPAGSGHYNLRLHCRLLHLRQVIVVIVFATLSSSSSLSPTSSSFSSTAASRSSMTSLMTYHHHALISSSFPSSPELLADNLQSPPPPTATASATVAAIEWVNWFRFVLNPTRQQSTRPELSRTAPTRAGRADLSRLSRLLSADPLSVEQTD